MGDAQPTAKLSNRAAALIKPGEEKAIWKVLADLWHPIDNPGGYVSLGVAENALMHNELAEFIKTSTNLPLSAFTYGDGPVGSKRLRAAIARFLTRRLHPVVPLKPEQVVVTNGVTTSIEHCSWALANPGEGVLLGRPFYTAFLDDIQTRPGVHLVQVGFDDVDPLSLEAVAKYEQAIIDADTKRGIKVRALMLCQPHNPLGRCYAPEVIRALMRLCQAYQIHLISDEIYALSVWKNSVDYTKPDNKSPPPVDFVSALAIDPQGIIDPSLVHVLWGVSKDFSANGLRVGCLISQNNPDFIAAVQQVGLYSYSSSISDHIIANVLEDESFVDGYVELNQSRIAEAYSLAAGFLQEHNIEYLPGANAAFFLWVNLGKAYAERHADRSTAQGRDHVVTLRPAAGKGEDHKETTVAAAAADVPAPAPAAAAVAAANTDDSDITAHLFQKLLAHKIFIVPGTVTGAEKPGWFRVVFTQPRDYVCEGLKRMLEAIEE